MTMTDPIADMLTRIRNAQRARFPEVDIPASKMKMAIANILQEEGFVEKVKFTPDNKQGMITISLKYNEEGEPVIKHLRRISKPGRRVYAPKTSIPEVLNGLGIIIISTSKGIMTDQKARQVGVGGEILCEVW